MAELSCHLEYSFVLQLEDNIDKTWGFLYLIVKYHPHLLFQAI